MLTNNSDTTQQVAGLVDGTLTIESLSLAGTPVGVTPTAVFYDEPLASQLQSSLQNLDPGQSLTFYWSTQLDGTSGASSQSFQTVQWSGDSNPALLSAVHQAGTYTLSAQYSFPSDLAPSGSTFIGPSNTASVEFTVGPTPVLSEAPSPILLIGPALLLLGLVAWRRARRTPRRRLAAVGFVAATLAAVSYQAPQAQATIVLPVAGTAAAGPGNAFLNAINNCLTKITDSGGEPAAILAALKAAAQTVEFQQILIFVPAPGVVPPVPPAGVVLDGANSANPAAPFAGALMKANGTPGGGTNTIVKWDPNNANVIPGDPAAVRRDPCASLYHELVHAYEISNGMIQGAVVAGKFVATPYNDGGTVLAASTAEVHATGAENVYRALNGLPRRTTYVAGEPLPLVTDGDFELLVNTGNGTFDVNPGSPELSPWTIGGNGIDHFTRSFWQPQQGWQSVDLAAHACGSIGQTIPTKNGTGYTVRWWMAGDPNGLPVIKTMKVSVNGTVLKTVTFNTTGKTLANMGWAAGSATFTATGSTSEVVFSDADSPCTAFGPALDSVSVRPTA
jgi:choice-of-anchor C domain-containing protein